MAAAIVGGVLVIFSVLQTFFYPIMFLLRWILVLEPTSRISHCGSQRTCDPVLAAPVEVWKIRRRWCGMGCTHCRGKGMPA